MQGRRALLVFALIALASGTAVAKPQHHQQQGLHQQHNKSNNKIKDCHLSECSFCPTVDETLYGSVEIFPLCPVPTPVGAPPEVVKQVETTVTLIFNCEDELWDDLLPDQQAPFRNGTYVPAEDIDIDLLDALDLLVNVSTLSPGGRKLLGNNAVSNNVAVNVTAGRFPEGLPVVPSEVFPGLVAILYLEEFKLWQILAVDAEALQEIIVRVSNIVDEQPNVSAGPASAVPQLRQSLRGIKKPKKRRPRSIVRNSYHRHNARITPNDDRLEQNSPVMRRLLQAATNDPLFPDQYHLDNIDAPEAWEITRGDKDVIIAVVDTGCDVQHPDLVRNLWVNKGEDLDRATDGIDNDGNGIVDDINGASFINEQEPNDLTDVSGHGTHVAGIAGARGNNAIGVSGVMQRIALMCLKALVGSTEPGPDPALGPKDAILRAWQYALRKGARIINSSWGSVTVNPDGSTQGLFLRISQDYIAEFVLFERPLLRLQQAGVLNVFSAGNDGVNIDPPNPTTSPNTVLYTRRNLNNDEPGPSNLQLNVVSTQENEDISPFSNFGIQGTDLGAPGSLILSTAPTGPAELFPGNVCSDPPVDNCLQDNIYGYLSGTSQAAPIVSGTTGLCLAILEPCHRHDDTQIAYDCILANVDNTAALAGRTRTGGRVNARATLECCQQFCNRRPTAATTATQKVAAFGDDNNE